MTGNAVCSWLLTTVPQFLTKQRQNLNSPGDVSAIPNPKIVSLAKQRSLPYCNRWLESRSQRGYTSHCHLRTGLAVEGCTQPYSWRQTWDWGWVNETGYNLTHSDPGLKGKVGREELGWLPDPGEAWSAQLEGKEHKSHLHCMFKLKQKVKKLG